MQDQTKPEDALRATMAAQAAAEDRLTPKGHFHLECRDSDGNLLWEEGIDNLVTTVGQNAILTSGYSGSLPGYMGLISGVSAVTLAAADTMTSHAGWNEVQNTGTNTPPYGTVRPTMTLAAASGGSIATSVANAYTFTAGGTVAGAFVVAGSGASATVANTGGTLMNEGTLATGQPVIATNVVTMTYTLTL